MEAGVANALEPISRNIVSPLPLVRGSRSPLWKAASEVAGRRFSDFSFAAGDFLDRLAQAVGANAFQNLMLIIDDSKHRLSITNL